MLKQLKLLPIFSLLFFIAPARAEDAVKDAQAQVGVGIAQELSLAFEKVAENVTPSVVTVSSESKPEKKPMQAPGKRPQIPFPFEDFFGEDFMDKMQPGPKRGLGTGVVIDAEGHILTNNHVVEDAKTVTIVLSNEKKLKAEVIATDPRSDLAILQLKTKEKLPPPVKLGDSDGLKIGEWVVAVGSSFGFRNTITAGIVSAKGRSLNGGSQYEDFIQTDAAINPGNSGGPLVNLNGEVVGINTAIISKSGGYMGIGFSIPINMAKSVVQSLLKNGKVTRGWLGVGIQNLDEDLAQNFNYSSTDGALVGHIDASGPAKKAGVAQGDIIVGIDGKSVKNVNELRNYVAGIAPGKDVEMTVIRNNKKINLTVSIGELKGQQGQQQQEVETDEGIGLFVENLTPEMKRRTGVKRNDGVIVTEVESDSAAQEAGIQPGDVIVSVDGEGIQNTDDFRKLMKKADLEKGIRVVIESQGMERFALLKSDD